MFVIKYTAKKMKLSIKDLAHLLKNSLVENLFFVQWYDGLRETILPETNFNLLTDLKHAAN